MELIATFFFGPSHATKPDPEQKNIPSYNEGMECNTAMKNQTTWN